MKQRIVILAKKMSPEANWPLYAILAAQIILTAPLIFRNVSYEDESTYRWTGWLEWMHWTGHVRLTKSFGTAWISGAPQIYPVINYLTGSLAAARLLNLAFMLGVTVLLWHTTQRFYTRKAAIAACALFAVTGATVHLGWYATYDAMALFFLALAAYLATRSADRQWWVGCVLALALASMTKYAIILWVPVVLAIVLLRAGWRRACLVAAGTVVIVWGVLEPTGDISGAVHTTFSRPNSHDSVLSVLSNSLLWAGVVIVLAIIGTVIAFRHHEKQLSWFTSLFTVAALLAPVEQARIHTLTSLDKHVDFGIWFGAMAAGYAVEQMMLWAGKRFSHRLLVEVTCAALLIPVAILGMSLQQNLPGRTQVNLIAYVKKMIPPGEHGEGIVTSSDLGHVVPSIARGWKWDVIRSYTVGHGYDQHVVIQRYVSLIRSGQATLIILLTSHPKNQNKRYVAALRSTHNYRLVGKVSSISQGYFYVWQRISANPVRVHKRVKKRAAHRRRASKPTATKKSA